ncbi:MAG TPA: hypothetical protein VF765_38040 [Polyangiaceae bacterium]
MPKRGKPDKRARNSAMVQGIRKHKAVFDKVPVGPDRLNADALIARFEGHTQVIDEIDDLDAKKSEAVASERKMEPEIRELRDLVLHAIRAHFGDDTIETESFGVKAKRPPRLPIATKAAAVVKRRATRKARHTMGPKQRKRIKGY